MFMPSLRNALHSHHTLSPAIGPTLDLRLVQIVWDWGQDTAHKEAG